MLLTRRLAILWGLRFLVPIDYCFGALALITLRERNFRGMLFRQISGVLVVTVVVYFHST